MPDRADEHPLLRLFRCPVGVAPLLSEADWSRVLEAARRSMLLGTLACRLQTEWGLSAVPERMRMHLRSALRVAQGTRRFVDIELAALEQAFARHDLPFCLLKGAAYVAASLEAGQGRLLSDIDILVPGARLAEAERVLVDHGWMTTKFDAYDQRYYRQWMHELPPMRHLDRGSSLDVHNTILPPTSKPKPDVKALWSEARSLGGRTGIFVLGPHDMILHSATHLFYDGDFSHGLRDLVDIDALLRSFSTEDGFWPALLVRARLHGLLMPLRHALRHCQGMLDTKVPDEVLGALEHEVKSAMPVGRFVDRVVQLGLCAVLERRPTYGQQMAGFILYVRSHYLRMPLRLLVPHLLRKRFVKD